MQRLYRTSACWRIFVLMLLTGLAACQRSAPSQTSNGAAPAFPAVVASVNGRNISTKLYDMYLKNGREALEIDVNSEEGRRTLEQLKEGIVSELIDRTLISQAAEEQRLLKIAPEKLAEAERKTVASSAAIKI